MEIDKNFSNSEIIGKRSYQEDYSAFALMGEDSAYNDALLAVISDGMGGYSSGDKASRIVVNSFVHTFFSDMIPISKAFKSALEIANSRIYNLSKEVGDCGATVVSVLFLNNKLYWLSVGDSAFYLFRNNSLIRLNADHSMRPIVEEKLKAGLITKEEAFSQKNLLLSGIMGDNIDLVDMNFDGFELQKGDVCVLASDGLESLSKNEIESILKEKLDSYASDIAAELTSAVESKNISYQDNTSVMIVKI